MLHLVCLTCKREFSVRLRLVLRKFDGKKSWKKKNIKEKKVGRKWVFFSCLDWRKNTRIWMRNLNIDELLESYWCHLSRARLEEVRNSFGNFFQTFLTILWEKFYHLFLTTFPSNSSIFFFAIFSRSNTRKKLVFQFFFLLLNFSRSKKTEP